MFMVEANIARPLVLQFRRMVPLYVEFFNLCLVVLVVLVAYYAHPLWLGCFTLVLLIAMVEL